MDNLTEQEDATANPVFEAGAIVVDSEGQSAMLVKTRQQADEALIVLRPGHGGEFEIPAALITQAGTGDWRLPVPFGRFLALSREETLVIPVIQEQLTVSKRQIETGRGIRLVRKVSQHEEIVDPPLLQEALEIEHVAIGRIVEGDVPGIRHEGDVMVIPVFEEVLVVSRQLRLKEEIRITRKSRTIHQAQTITLRSEHVVVERFGDDEKSPDRSTE